MNWIYFHRVTYVSFLLVSLTSAVIIVPAPTLGVESVSTTTVTLNWTTPVNELYDSFTVEVFSSATRIRAFSTNDTRVVIDNLTPGFLYSFIVRTVRGELESDNSNVLQDTVPLPPTNLRLESFDQLVMTISGIFGDITFTLDVPGIKANWEGPQRGVCDCYLATIDPNEGRVSQSTDNDRVLPRCHEIYCSERRTQEFSENDPTLPQANRLDRSTIIEREFIELTPGQTYTISVRSTTCSHGFLGPLQSAPVNATITLPPSNPPVVKAEQTTNITTYLSWKGLIPGFFDSFELTLLTETDERITIETPTDPRTQGRNLTGLKPCTTYGFELFSVNKGMRSRGSQSAEVYTRPTPPTNLQVTDFTESSISVKWRHSGNQNTAGFEVSVENVMTIIRPANSRSATLPGLQPGTIYTLSVSAQCIGEERIDSYPAQVVQVTVPLPPKAVTSSCMIVEDEKNPDAYSRISLSWKEPQLGNWDGFVLHYSPFVFYNNISNPRPPVVLPKDTFNLEVIVPTTGRTFTGQIRATSENIFSNAETVDIVCRNREGESRLRCVVPSDKWTITITEVNATVLYIEVSELPLHNITVTFCASCDLDPFVTTAYKFYTLNPCSLPYDNLPELVVTVYPICDKGLLCLPIKRRRSCEKSPVIPNKGSSSEEPIITNPTIRTPPDACCNGRSYDKSVAKCCHNKLKSLEETYLLCCYTRWYDRTTHKCCGQRLGEGFIRPSTSECI